MAVDMALSLREHTTLPVGVACDAVLADRARSRYGEVFDRVTTIPERFLGGRTRKFGVAEASPFDETVFVDADCIVLKPIDELFASLEGCDLAFLGSQLTESDDHNHHGFSTRWLMRKFELSSYLKTNSGVFCFRKGPAIEVMEAFRACHEDEARPRLRGSILLGRWLGDEIAIGIVGGRRGLCAMPFPDTMYWPQEFDSIDLDHPAKPLLHFIWPPSERLLEDLLEGMRQRRKAAGVGGSGEEHWRAEVRSLEHMKRRRRLLERIGWW
jgi:hypothetical protein